MYFWIGLVLISIMVVMDYECKDEPEMKKIVIKKNVSMF